MICKAGIQNKIIPLQAEVTSCATVVLMMIFMNLPWNGNKTKSAGMSGFLYSRKANADVSLIFTLVIASFPMNRTMK